MDHDDDDMVESIGHQARQTSRPGRQLACKLAEYDALVATKAMAPSWKTS
jgi:hypothetical protein